MSKSKSLESVESCIPKKKKLFHEIVLVLIPDTENTDLMSTDFIRSNQMAVLSPANKTRKMTKSHYYSIVVA